MGPSFLLPSRHLQRSQTAGFSSSRLTAALTLVSRPSGYQWEGRERVRSLSSCLPAPACQSRPSAHPPTGQRPLSTGAAGSLALDLGSRGHRRAGELHPTCHRAGQRAVLNAGRGGWHGSWVWSPGLTGLLACCPPLRCSSWLSRCHLVQRAAFSFVSRGRC
jgi:hypothetical protein